MITLAIIDHKGHQLFIESVEEKEILLNYNGEEEAYIRDKYNFNDTDSFSWEYLTERIELFGAKNSDILIHFN